jgi:hypothetical protein
MTINAIMPMPIITPSYDGAGSLTAESAISLFLSVFTMCILAIIIRYFSIKRHLHKTLFNKLFLDNDTYCPEMNIPTMAICVLFGILVFIGFISFYEFLLK